jgi:archaellum component FlaC
MDQDRKKFEHVNVINSVNQVIDALNNPKALDDVLNRLKWKERDLNRLSCELSDQQERMDRKEEQIKEIENRYNSLLLKYEESIKERNSLMGKLRKLEKKNK